MVTDQIQEKDTSSSAWNNISNSLLVGTVKDEPEFLTGFAELKSLEDRVKLCYEHQGGKFRRCIGQIVDVLSASKHQKYWEKAHEFRVEGNDLFKKKLYADALHFYTKAILSAPLPENESQHPEELSLAFGNRSATYFYLKEWEKCLHDIEQALEHDFPSDLRSKLLSRREMCVKELEKGSSINKRVSAFWGDGVDFSRNSKIPNASASLEVKVSDEKGRYVVANDDIKVGEILFMEKPYASVLLPSFYESYCHHCSATLSGLPVMPCKQCNQVSYCSKQCVDESWMAYHKFECGYLDLLHEIGIAHLSFRTVLVTGIEKACLICKELESTNEKRAPEDSNYECNYASVLKLLDHSDDFNFEDLFKYTLTSLLLLIIASDKLKLISRSHENFFTLGGLYLKHILQLICNGHAISRTEVNFKNGSYYTEEKRIATGIYPSVSLMNHSCSPNIFPLYKGNLLIIKASKPIAKGKEVNNCYGPHYLRMSLLERQKALKDQYFFNCKCPACANDKKVFFNAFCCPACAGPMIVNEESDDNITGNCQNCGANRIDMKQRWYEFKASQKLLLKGSLLLDEGINLEAEKNLVEAHMKLNDILHPLNKDLGRAKDELARCYARMDSLDKAVLFCKDSTDIVRKLFGPASIELTNELIKLSDLQWEIVDRTDGSVTVMKPLAKDCLVSSEKALKLLKLYIVPGSAEDHLTMECCKIEERVKYLKMLLQSAGYMVSHPEMTNKLIQSINPIKV